jgi:DNA repair photolyase
MVIEEYRAKSLVRTGNPSLFSWADLYLNPYQGCAHDCRYCDGKSEGYYLHSDFATRIRVKANAPDLLESELRKRGFVPEARSRLDAADAYQTELIPSRPGKPILGIGGGVCDVYQPVEEQLRITRRLLEIAADFCLPVALLTKNALALRDLDLLKRINAQSHAACNFTITLADDGCQHLFEPGASSTSDRFEAMRTLRQAGIHSGIYFCPVLPLISDTEENMRSVYDRARDAGAEFVWCGGLTLKPGRNKQEFLALLRAEFPSLLPAYERLYGNDDRHGMPDRRVCRTLKLPDPERVGFRLSVERGMGHCAERYIPGGRPVPNLRAAEFLMRVAFIRRLTAATPSSEGRALSTAARLLEDNIGLAPIDLLPRVPAPACDYLAEYLNGQGEAILSRLRSEALQTCPPPASEFHPRQAASRN